MKILIDDAEILTITEQQLEVLKYMINADNLTADITSRIQYVITDKITQAETYLKQDFNGDKLQSLGITSIPTDNSALIALILALPECKCRKTRDLEAQIALQPEV